MAKVNYKNLAFVKIPSKYQSTMNTFLSMPREDLGKTPNFVWTNPPSSISISISVNRIQGHKCASVSWITLQKITLQKPMNSNLQHFKIDQNKTFFPVKSEIYIPKHNIHPNKSSTLQKLTHQLPNISLLTPKHRKSST